MGPHESGSSSTAKPTSDIDCLLAGAGYKVRSSELNHVARSLERLDTALVNAPDGISLLNGDATVHHNPSDIVSWVDSLLSELNQPSDLSYVELNPSTAPPAACDVPDLGARPQLPSAAPQQVSEVQQLTAVVTAMEEDSGIRLVQLLMTCAESVQRGDITLAGFLIKEMRALLTRVNTWCGIGKVAGYFIDALSRRVYSPPQALAIAAVEPGSREEEIVYRHFYDACPYLKFAHFTANKAILEAFDGCDRVHVVDFSLMQGLQWPALIQALALRPGGPPSLRFTGIGPPTSDGHDSLRQIGLRLDTFARSVNVQFTFRSLPAARLDDVKRWMMLQVEPTEALAVNFVMQLHRLLAPDESTTMTQHPQLRIDSFLRWIRGLNPRVVTVVEQEADHNRAGFLDRFTEALYYYSSVFDSLAAIPAQRVEMAVAEMYVQREICDVVCCEGAARAERHEPLAKWRARFLRAGFAPLHLGSDAFKLARLLLTMLSAEGYSVEENEGCLTLGWHSRPLIATSAWRAMPDFVAAGMHPNGAICNI